MLEQLQSQLGIQVLDSKLLHPTTAERRTLDSVEDLPPEAQGIRDEWEARSGIGRKEDVRAAADL